MNQAIGGIVGTTGLIVGLQGARMAGHGSGKTRNFASELGGMPLDTYLEHVGDLGDQQFDWQRQQARLNLELYPEYAAMQRLEQARTANQVNRLTRKFGRTERDLTSLQRRGDVADLGLYGDDLAVLYGELSPAYAALDSQAAEAGQPSELLGYLNRQAMGTNPLLERLQAQAEEELAMGRELSPEQAREAQQAARAAWSGRGLLYSNPAVAAEVLSRDAAATARQSERRAFAGTVLGLDRAERAADAQVEMLNQQDAGQRTNRLLAINQAKLNPILDVLSRRTGVNPGYVTGSMAPALSVTAPAGVMSTAPQVSTMSGALSPLYNYGADVYNTNFNAAETRAFNKANAYVNLGAGLISAGGQISSSGGGGGGGSMGGFM